MTSSDTSFRPSGTNRSLYFGAVLVPILAFGSTLAGMALHNAGLLGDIQYAALGGFFASCLLAYFAWTRLHKDIVALSTPIYGFIFLVTPIDYTGGVALQLIYASGLSLLTARLFHRFGAGTPGGASGTELETGPFSAYVESTRDVFAALDPVAGHSAALAFIRFAEGEYHTAAEVSHAAVCRDGTPEPVVRAFSILRQHAELLDKNQPRPVTCLMFLPDDATLLAKPLTVSDDPEREFERQMDNALLLLYSAAWHASPADRPSLLASQVFATKLLEA
jgi:hypothetical protein